MSISSSCCRTSPFRWLALLPYAWACAPHDAEPAAGSAGESAVQATGAASGSSSSAGSSVGGAGAVSGSSAAGAGNGGAPNVGGGGGKASAGGGASGEADQLVPLPDPIDPAASDPDFSIQGEYVGFVKAGAQDLPLGAQLIALGNAEFRAVFEPGGLPGEGFSGVKIDVNGKRTGNVASFAPGIQARAVDTGGQFGNYSASAADGKLTGNDDQNRPFTLERVLRKSPTLARKAPPGALVLFDGTSTKEFVQGPPNDYPNTYFPGEGGMTPEGLLKDGATTLRNFGDCTVHVEFRVPFAPALDPNYRGNSGVYLQGAYELNILDSLGLSGKQKDNGVIWGERDPDVNMSYPPLSWQTFDIDFVAARWNGDQKLKNAQMSVKFNDVTVHQNVEISGATTHNPLPETNELGPIFFQANPFQVRFRYVWVLAK